MDTPFEYECPKCRYRVVVRPGSSESMTQAACECLTCREIVDVVVWTDAPDFMEGLNRCPNCRGRNWRLWTEARLCPKCGRKMLEFQVGLWD